MKKSKNNIVYTCLEHIDRTHSKSITSIGDNINNDPTKIYFCDSYINVKITRNLSIKSMSEVITKLSRIYIDL